MTVLHIGTLNCRGGSNKVDLLIDTIEKSSIDILCMQETHLINDSDKIKIERICKGNLYLNNGNANSRGVATFVREKEEIITDKITIKKDYFGRMLNIQIKIRSENWCISNIYAPNGATERSDFFSKIDHDIQNLSSERIFLLVDFNNILDRQLDRNNNDTKGAMKSDKSKDVLRRLIESNCLVDGYRHLNPFGINYTFTGSSGYRARLDRIYIDNESVKSIASVTTQGVPYTDHDLVTLTFGEYERSVKWGNGRWILNKKLLFDRQTQDDLRDLWLHWRERKACHSSILDWWDEGKKLIADVYKINGKRLKEIRKKKNGIWKRS